ncbi:MAG: outer membrane beta-barrel protein [Bacteroidota bacterium]
MQKIFVVWLLLLGSITSWAQESIVKGSLKDAENGTPIIGATVLLISVKDTTDRRGAASDVEGQFVVKGLSTAFYKLQITSIGYEPFKTFVRVNQSAIDLGDLSLKVDTKVLDGVKVEGEVVPVEQKGDTTEYNSLAYKTNPDANAEDLIRKMPGIVINQSGVQAQGENVQRVLVDGREFFGNDPTLALKTLPAEVIDKIQVFDQLSDQSQFSGFNDGNTTKTINIVTKPNMRDGQFGRAFAGAGTDDLYNAGGNINFFDGPSRLSILGMANNINQQNFSNEDILGVASTSNRRRGGRGGGGRTGGSRGGGGFRGRSIGSNVNDFLVGQQNGISETQSFGVNYGNEWGDKLKLNGSYFFNRIENTNDQILNRETFVSGESSQFYDEESLSGSTNFNHRLNLRMQYAFDKSNSIIFTPSLSFQHNEANDLINGQTVTDSERLLNTTNNNFISDNSGFNFSSRLLYRHAFSKRGRTFSVRIQTQANSNNGDSDLNAFNEFFQGRSSTIDSLNQNTLSDGNGYTLSSNIIYTEPIGQRAQLQFNYNISYSENMSDRETFSITPGDVPSIALDTALTNNFENDYITHRPSVGIFIRNQKFFLRGGLAYQYAELQSDQVFPVEANVSRSFNNVLPTFFARLNISREKNLRFIYRTQTDAPSVNQLQNVIDNTDPLFLSGGNQNLEQSYTHRFITRYSNTKADKGTTFFSFLLVTNTQDYVADGSFIAQQDSVLQDGIVLNEGSQLNIPVNTNGYWNIRTFNTFGMPAKWLKSNVNLNIGYTYTRIPSLINGLSNISQTSAINSSLVVASNISEKVDFTLSYNADYNIVDNSIQPQLNSNFLSQTFGGRLNWIFWKGIVFRTDMNYQTFNGLSDGFNQDYVLWNASIGKKFLKDQRAEIQLSVFDLLKENRSISRSNSDSFIEETQTQVLQQYFMATFTYVIRNFPNKGKG